MNFEEAEAKFRQLQARVQRGEPISRAEYEEQVSRLAVQDNNGVLWEINPRTGKWMYFDGAEWVAGTPPGHDNSTVMPMPSPVAPPAASTQPAAPTTSPAPRAAPSPKPVAPPPQSAPQRVSSAPRPVPSAPSKPPLGTEPVPTFRRTGQDKKTAPARPSGNIPSGRDQPSARPPRPNDGTDRNREWIPLAIGAVVLLICATLLFVGGNFALSALGSTKTPTRSALPLVTNTPVPTIVRLPSPTPVPPTPIPVTGKVIERTVNVREQPNTKAKILTTVKKDKALTLIARNDDGTWYRVNLENLTQPGWIFGATLQVTGGDPQTLPVAGPTPTPTKAAGPPPPVQPTATLTPIGVIPPTPKP